MKTIMDDSGIEDLLERQESMYKLVILAARRAKEIAEGAPPLVSVDLKKVTSIALEEIRQGKVRYKVVEDAQGGKKSKTRGAKAKEKKRTGA